MSNVARKPQRPHQTRSKAGLMKMGFKKKSSRNWGAGIVAAGIAIAWTIGGLVMPSMAENANAENFVHAKIGKWEVSSQGESMASYGAVTSKGFPVGKPGSRYTYSGPDGTSTDWVLIDPNNYDCFAKQGGNPKDRWLWVSANSGISVEAGGNKSAANPDKTGKKRAKKGNTAGKTKPGKNAEEKSLGGSKGTKDKDKVKEDELGKDGLASSESEKDKGDKVNNSEEKPGKADTTSEERPAKVDDTSPESTEPSVAEKAESADTKDSEPSAPASTATESGTTQAAHFTTTPNNDGGNDTTVELPEEPTEENTEADTTDSDDADVTEEGESTGEASEGEASEGEATEDAEAVGEDRSAGGKAGFNDKCPVKFGTTVVKYRFNAVTLNTPIGHIGGGEGSYAFNWNALPDFNGIGFNGKHGFCIEPEKGIVAGGSYGFSFKHESLSQRKQDMLTALAYNYAKRPASYHTKYYYAQTQLAMWTVVKGMYFVTPSMNNIGSPHVNQGQVESILNEAKQHLAEAKEQKSKAEEAIKALKINYLGMDEDSNEYRIKLEGYPAANGVDLSNIKVKVEGGNISSIDNQLGSGTIITLADAAKGFTVVANSKKGPKVSFEGTVDVIGAFGSSVNMQDVIMYDPVKIPVKGELELPGAGDDSSKPEVRTTALVNGQDANKGGAESVDLAKVQGDSITLSDNVDYSGLAKMTTTKHQYFLLGQLKRVRDGKTTDAWKQMRVHGPLDIPRGSLKTLFPAKLKVDNLRPGDKYYYEEYIGTTDPRFEGDKGLGKITDPTTGAELNVVAKHVGENPDQTVQVGSKSVIKVTKKIQPEGDNFLLNKEYSFDADCFTPKNAAPDVQKESNLVQADLVGKFGQSPHWWGYSGEHKVKPGKTIAIDKELPQGTMCVLWENIPGGDADKYQTNWSGGRGDVVTYTDGGGAVHQNAYRVYVEDTQPEINVTATNTLIKHKEQPLPTMVIAKKVVNNGSDAIPMDRKYRFVGECHHPKDIGKPDLSKETKYESNHLGDLVIGQGGYVRSLNQHYLGDGELVNITQSTDPNRFTMNPGTMCFFWEEIPESDKGKYETKWEGDGETVEYWDYNQDLSKRHLHKNVRKVFFPADENAAIRDVKITAVNVYGPADKPKNGSIQLTKQVETTNGVNNPWQDKTYNFSADCMTPTKAEAATKLQTLNPLGRWNVSDVNTENKWIPSIDVKAGQSVVINQSDGKPFPAGTMCAVWENTGSDANATNTLEWNGAGDTFTYKDGGDVVHQNARRVIVKEDMNGQPGASVTAVNKLTVNTGSFKLTKSVVGIETNSAATANNGGFNFTYTCTGTSGEITKRGDVTLNAANNWSVQVDGVPAVSRCVVQEAPVTAPTGYKAPKLSWNVNGSGAADGTVTIQGNTVSTVVATNTYEADNVTFNLKKVVKADDGTQLDGNYRFRLVCGDKQDNVTLNKSNNYSFKVAKVGGAPLRAGTSCTVSETEWQKGDKHDWKSVDFRVDGATGKVDTQNRAVTFTLPTSATEVMVTATNNYQRQVGSIQITKTATPNTKADLAKDKVFTFEADCINPVDNSWVDWATVDVKAGETKSFQQGRWVGTKCYIWERKSSDSDVTSTVTWSGDGDTVSHTDRNGVKHDDARLVTIKADKDNASAVKVTAANKLEAQNGTFKIHKTVTAADATVSGNFKFKYSCTAPDGKNYTQAKPFNRLVHEDAEGYVRSVDFIEVANGQESAPITVPGGSKCEVTEVSPANADAPQVKTGDNANPLKYDSTAFAVTGEGVNLTKKGLESGKFTVAKGRDLTVTATNTYVEQVAGFQFSKSVTGNNASKWQSHPFDFYYTCKDKKGNKYPKDAKDNIGRKTLTAGADAVKVEKLPVGTECRLWEGAVKKSNKFEQHSTVWTVDKAAKKTAETKSVTDFAGKSHDNGVSFKITKQKTPVVIAVENQFRNPEASISVSKQALADGEDFNVGNKEFTVDIKCVNPNDKAELTVATGLALRAGTAAQTFTADSKGTKLLNGAKCTVTENKDSAKLTGYTWKSVTFAATAGDQKVTTTKQGDNAASFVIPAKDNAAKGNTAVAVTLTNAYERQMGSISVTKQVSFTGGTNPDLQKAKYEFQADCFKPTLAHPDLSGETNFDRRYLGNLVGNKHNVHWWHTNNKAASGETLTVKDLPVGTMCFFWEKPFQSDKFDLSWSGGDGQTVTYTSGTDRITNAYRVIVAENGTKPSLAKVTATNAAKYGMFTLSKQLSGNGAADDAVRNQDYTFKVACDGAEPLTASLNVGKNKAMWTLPENTVTVGSKCRIHEVKADIAGYTSELSWSGTGLKKLADGGIEITVPNAGTDLNFTAVNTFNKAGFKIAKSVIPTGTQFDGNFKFTYNCEVKDAKPITGSVEVPAAGESKEILVPAGASCTVTEADPAKAPAVNTAEGQNPLQYATNGTSFDVAGKGLTSGKFTVAANTVKTITATNTYVEKVNGFQLTKKVEGNNAAKWKGEEFNFGYSCQAPNKTLYPEGGIGQASLANGESSKVDNLPAGTQCVVWEEPVSAKEHEAQPETTWSVVGDAKAKPGEVSDFKGKNHPNGVKFTVQDGSAVSVSATNKFEIPTTSLTVKKTVVKDELSTVPSAFQVSVDCTYSTDGQKHTIATNQPLTAEKPLTFSKDNAGKAIPVGSTCTVTEDSTSATVPGHTWTVKVNGADQPLVAVTEANKSTANQVEVVNTYQRDMSLTLQKVVKTNDGTEQNGQFTFDVRCGEMAKAQQVTLDASNGYRQVLTELTGLGEDGKLRPGMACTIKESAQNPADKHYAWKSVKFKADGAQSVTPGTDNDVTFALPSDGKSAAVEVTATNHYELALGKLLVQKEVRHPNATNNPWPGKTYTFEVNCYDTAKAPQGKDGRKYAYAGFNVGPKHNWQWELPDPSTQWKRAYVGSTCYVWERLPQNTDSVTNQMTWSDDSAGETVEYQDSKGNKHQARKVVIKAADAQGNPTVKVKAINTLTVKYGNFNLAKALDGTAKDDTAVKGKDFTFNVDCNGVKNLPAVTLKAGESKVALPADKVKVGTKCRIHEAPYRIPGITSDLKDLKWSGGTPVANNGVEVTVGAADTNGTYSTTVTATNQVEYDLAKFKVRKAIASDETLTFDKPFEFSYSCEAPGVKAYDTSLPLTGTINVPANGEPVEVTLPSGAECTMTETNPEGVAVTGDAANLVKYASTSFTSAGETVQGTTYGSFFVTKGYPMDITATNTYVPKTATGFQITKTVTGNSDANHQNDEFTFGYSCQPRHGKAITGSVVLSQKDGQKDGMTKLVKDLPVGSECSLWENPATKQTGEKEPATTWAIGKESAKSGVDVKDATGTTHANGVTFPVGSESETVSINVTNKFDLPLTSLSVFKTVKSDDLSSIPADKTYTVDVTCKYATDGSTHDFKVTDLKPGEENAQTVGLDDEKKPVIPVGSSCTVTKEDETTASVAGHDLKMTVNGADRALKPDAEANRIEVVNTYTRHTGGFTLTKETAGLDRAKAAQANDGAFNFGVTCRDDEKDLTLTEAQKNLRLDAANKWSAKVTGLPEGAKCTLKEATTKVPAGYQPVKLSWSGADNGVVTVVNGQNVAVKATNTYKRNEVGFTLKKVVTTTDNKALEGSYSFTVTCGNKSEDVTLVAGGAHKFTTVGGTTLLAGTSCTVTETQLQDFPTYQWQSMEPAVTGASQTAKAERSVTFTLPDQAPGDGEAEVSVTVTNRYQPKQGAFSLKKMFAGDAKDDANVAKAEFIFTVTCSSSDGDKSATLRLNKANQWTDRLEGLDAGYLCRVHEEPVTIDGVNSKLTGLTSNHANWDPSGKAQGITKAPDYDKTGDYSVVVPNETVKDLTLMATNTVTYDKAKFQVKKVVVAAGIEDTRDFKFTYSCTGPDGRKYTQKNPFEGAVADFVTVKGGAASDPITVPAGSTCQVTEDASGQTPMNAEELNYSSTSFVTNQKDAKLVPVMQSGEFKLAKDETVEVTATNTYVEEKASFQFSKAVTGNYAGKWNDKTKQKFNFGYSCQAPGAKGKVYTSEKPIQLGHTESHSVEGIPVGSKCVLWEESVKAKAGETVSMTWTKAIAAAEKDGAKPEKVTAEAKKGIDVTDHAEKPGKHPNGISFIVPAKGKLSLQATNTFEMPLGTLTVVKSLKFDAKSTIDEDRKFQVNVTCTLSTDGSEKTFDTVSLGNGNHRTFEGIPVGSSCTISETNADVPGHTWEMKVLDGEKDVTKAVKLDSKTKTVTLENTYKRVLGSFAVKKVVKKDEVKGALAKELPTKFNFKWEATKVPDGFTLEPDNGEFQLGNDDRSKDFSGFPVGTKITITETDGDKVLPTGTAMSTTWAWGAVDKSGNPVGKGWTDDKDRKSVTLEISGAAGVMVTATNKIEPTEPDIPPMIPLGSGQTPPPPSTSKPPATPPNGKTTPPTPPVTSTTPVNGKTTPPGGGDNPPNGGTTPPGGGDNPPNGGSTPPNGGTTPPPDQPNPPVSPSNTTPPTTPPEPSNPPVSPATTTPVIPPAPPVAPAVTLPPTAPKLPPTLARTGAQAMVVGILAVAMIGAGGLFGLLAAKRRRREEEEDR